MLQSSFDDDDSSVAAAAADESDSSSAVVHRIQRSAKPILNESPSSQFAFENKLNLGEEEKRGSFNDAPPAAGRLHNLINPTNTIDYASSHNLDLSHGTLDDSMRFGKNLNENNQKGAPFFEKGDPRLPSSPGSPNNPMIIATPTMAVAMNTRPFNRGGRQNPNPNVQDIITGIVKLLNGNVNVHANTSPSRRPVHTRINNRGPPRISDVQFTPEPPPPPTLPTARPPPPYPFDRPDPSGSGSPPRPFMNTEQMLPHKNGKPGFISQQQNRYPWQRPHPRPPIGAMVNRQPIPTFNQPPLPPQQPTLWTDSNNDNRPTSGAGQEEEENYEVSESVNEVNEAEDAEHPLHQHQTTTTAAPEPGEEDDDEIVKKQNQNANSSVPDLLAISQLHPSTTELAPEYHPPRPASTVDHRTPSLDLVTHSASSSSSSSATEPNFPKQTADHSPAATPPPASRYVPRPGLVLDDPEFKPGQKNRNSYPQQRPQQPQQPHSPARPPGYGEIFDITLSAIQGPTGGGSGVQTINIKPFGADKYNDEIIVSPTGTEGFVSIDGKRTYINLFGEQTDQPVAGPEIKPTATISQHENAQQQQQTKAPHYGIVEKAPLNPNGLTGTVSNVPHKPLYRPRPPQPAGAAAQPGQQSPSAGSPPRIDTCIVGDDSTCDKTQNEACRIEFGVSSCHCRPGYARRNDRDPCRRIVSLLMSLRVDKIFERKLSWDAKLAQPSSEPYLQLSFEAARAVMSAMDMTPFSDDFMEARVNKIYKGDTSRGEGGIFVNVTLKLSETGETVRPQLRNDIQKHLLGVIHRRNNNIGNSALYVESPTGAVSHLQDVDECSTTELNDCHAEAVCTNVWGSFACECQLGYRDPWHDQPHRAGRECLSCPDSVCNNRGTCHYSEEGKETCECVGNYYGSQCEIDGEVLGVAIGASVAAVIIIVLTLVCLIMWSRRWQREQKQLVSPVFGYMNTVQQMKAQQAAASSAYTISLEERMRWAQIADVMAQQGNHYGVEPVVHPGTMQMRPGSAMYNYPTLQALSNMGVSMAGTLPMHQQHHGMPPIPMPR